MKDEQVTTMVRNRYAAVAAGRAGCCAGTATPDEASGNMGYSGAELASVPEGANLGSGAGFDCFLAAQAVGSDGRVIGVEMTHEMLRRARDNAARVNAANVEFRLGEIEHLPVADNTADVVIANCVINLVPDKARVYREAFRVLKPGGRIAISDVVNIAPLPAELATDEALLCGCVAGAAASRQIQQWLAAAGFIDSRIILKPESRELVKTWAPGRGIENYVASATIEARKPDTARV